MFVLLVVWFILERSRIFFPSWKHAVVATLLIAIGAFIFNVLVLWL